MCIAVFLWQSHPLYPFLLLLNRDEYHNRPTKATGWWEGGEILGGRDEVGGGTWLACSKEGRFAFLTNVLELHASPEAKTRGDLPIRFLESKKSPKAFAEELVKEAHEYNGFNLIMVDLLSKSMFYISNRPKGEAVLIHEVKPGIHVLSNAKLDSPWPKAQRLVLKFKKLIEAHGEGDDISMEELAEKLMKDKEKVADESKLPHICSLDWEYSLSSIFVEVDTPLGCYGTRSTAGIKVKANGEVCFHEMYLENSKWEAQTVNYHIQRNDQKIKQIW
ncbi:transport and Golgi organization 2-like [Heracleum sosnowskyi]|uniref:Transport and Golgi organization 2-like n=1 Tax=Heracleum sosnowskyi TaxID=360622 RepID=A0AAD8JD92_9APIA|nr:transport and Golgi organization 2-like [Heracleum sosnowskyi]